MKKLFTTIFFLLSVAAFAQTDIGLRAGANMPFATGDLKTYGKGLIGFNAGIYTRENKGKVNFIFEAFYSSLKYKDDALVLYIHSINIPFLVEAKISNVVSVQGGITPYVSLNNYKTASGDNLGDELSPANIDLTVGLNFKLGKDFGLVTRFNYPTLNASKDDDVTYKPMNVSLGLTYRLFTDL